MRSFEFEELRIPLTAIKTGKCEFKFETVLQDIDAGEGRRFPDNIRITARITTVGPDFLLDLRVESEGDFVCDRCGASFRPIIQGGIQTLFTFHPADPDVEDDDVRVLEPGTDEIDLRRDVIDALILAVPAKAVCRESCKGLCPRCGTNLNETDCGCTFEEIDPRWDVLRRLKPDS